MQYFDINHVRLTPGSVYYDRQQNMNAFLLSISDDQMLYNFRQAAGLPTGDAAPMTGWDEPTGKLRGHTTGHYLSGLALAYAATGDVRFREKAGYLVRELGKCQDAFAAGGKTAPGFLSAYDEEQFDLLEQLTPYPEIWAPYYTLDKIMSGLFDCYVLTGNAQALAIEEKIADWIRNRLSKVPAERRSEMWATYIAGEYGGMIATLARLSRITGKREYLDTAALFYKKKLFDPMERGEDVLAGMHANQHIPQVIGAMELYDATGDDRYRRIAENFWSIVTTAHQYVNGGVGEGELFREPHAACRYLTDRAEESCASYNMLRLTGLLFEHRGDAALMDYYENTLLNHIMASASHAADGGTTYFLPLCPGGRKAYSTEENTCCHGTGMESRYRFMEHIYSYDAEALYVNLLVPSILHAADGEPALLALDITPDGTVCISAGTDMDKCLRVRMPAWTGCAGYVELCDQIRAGEQYSMELTMALQTVDCGTADTEAFAALRYGPYLLAGLSEDPSWIDCPDSQNVRKAQSASAAAGDRNSDLIFDAGSMRMVPVANVDTEAYHVYFRHTL